MQWRYLLTLIQFTNHSFVKTFRLNSFSNDFSNSMVSRLEVNRDGQKGEVCKTRKKVGYPVSDQGRDHSFLSVGQVRTLPWPLALFSHNNDVSVAGGATTGGLQADDKLIL